MLNPNNYNNLFWVNIFTFIIAISYAVILYAGSSFLGKTLGEENIWIIYSIAGITTIILNLSVSNFLRKIPIKRLTNLFLILAFLNLLFLYKASSISQISTSFIFYITLGEFIFLLASIMVEDLSKDDITGNIRGRFISMSSLGYIIAPFLASFLIKNYQIENIFLASSFFIFIGFLVLNLSINKLKKIEIENNNVRNSLIKIIKNKDIRNIISLQVALSIFYACIVLYIPFKLEEAGISLVTYLGILLPFALLPFLFIPSLLGHFEDEFENEKEVLYFSFIGLSLILIIIALSNFNNLILWALILFISRVFASSAETSINSYLFKHINEKDTGIISIFSSSQTLAYFLFSTLLGSIIIKYFGIQILFLTVSLILIFMIFYIKKLGHYHEYIQKKKNYNIKIKAKRRASI